MSLKRKEGVNVTLGLKQSPEGSKAFLASGALNSEGLSLRAEEGDEAWVRWSVPPVGL